MTMVGDLSTRLKLLQSDLKKLENQVENTMIGTYDEWKEVLKMARHLEALAITRMSVIKYMQATTDGSIKTLKLDI